MGYSICLSRMNVGTFEDSNPITLNEWLKVIEDDNEFQSVNTTGGINPITKVNIIIEVPGHALWRNNEKNCEVEFHFRKGKVCVEDYNQSIINKMKLLATKLDAKVFDDFDEEL